MVNRGLPVRLVCFDLNKTLIIQNSWLDLNLAMGVTAEEDQILFDWFSEGIIDYQQWMRIIMSIYRKRSNPTRAAIERALFTYSYLPGARETVSYLHKKGYIIALISGSMQRLVARVARELQISLFQGTNTLHFDDAGLLSRIESLGDENIAKVGILEDFCDELGIEMVQCACIGDGDNDLPLFERTGHGITFTGSDIENQAEFVIDSLLDICQIL